MDDRLGQMRFGKVSLDLLTECPRDMAQLSPKVSEIMMSRVAEDLSP